MWNGKNKAVTFSFDDGVIQDIRLIEILDKYGLKATFNLNSALLGREQILDSEGKVIQRGKVKLEDVKKLYANHEVGAHTLNHPNLVGLTDEQIITEINEDVKALEALTDKPVKVFAYPFGTTDDRVCEVIKKHTNVKLARTVWATDSFDVQRDLICFKPTVYYVKIEELYEKAKKFLELKADKPQVFYVWGHAYELDDRISWEKFEEFCKLIANKDDVFYGTNSEVYGL